MPIRSPFVDTLFLPRFVQGSSKHHSFVIKNNLFITRFLLLDMTFHEVWLQIYQNIKLRKSFECWPILNFLNNKVVLLVNAFTASYHPCFIVFDILVINDKKLANVPLHERIRTIEK